MFIDVTIVGVVADTEDFFIKVDVSNEVVLLAVLQGEGYFNDEWSGVEISQVLRRKISVVLFLANLHESRTDIFQQMHQVLTQVIKVLLS